jgi:hypothetical protein
VVSNQLSVRKRKIRNVRKQLGATVLFVWKVFAAGTAFSQQTTNSGAPISLHLLKPDEPAPLGVRFGSPSERAAIFLVSNHTAKTVIANLTGVEVKSGSNWITQLRPFGPLVLSASNSIRMRGATNAFMPGLTTFELGPHQAAYSTISFSGQTTPSGPVPGSPVGCAMNYLAGQPTGAVWRLTVTVQEKLTGLADVEARIKDYPRIPSRKAAAAAAGITNAVLSPFSRAFSYFGKPKWVSSDEVPLLKDEL